MKTIIITLAIAAFALVGNISNAFSRDNFYKNDEVNEIGQIVKTTVCTGESDKHLTPIKQFENKYDNNGNLRERVVSIWDSMKSKWVSSRKYQYDYTTDGQLQMLSYTTYNESTKVWENETKYAMYMYNSEGNLLSIDYLNIGNKEYEALASDFN